jgi:hypothetical protein
VSICASQGYASGSCIDDQCVCEGTSTGACDDTRCSAACRAFGASGGACASPTRCECGGAPDGGGDDGGVPGDGAGDDCSDGAKRIYLVTEEKVLLRFWPPTLELTEVGTLDCAPTSAGATPFAMSIDRSAGAWVLYNDGEIFRVDTATARCASTAFVPGQEGFDVFGMAFVADAPGGSAETLFIAGQEAGEVPRDPAKLGRIDLGSLDVTYVASLASFPDLTGTGAAELWGFFPFQSPAVVQRIDKADGTVDRTQTIPFDFTGTTAWAFAFWGGDFYLFVEGETEASSTIYRLETDTGTTSPILPDTGYSIVGAGVSTCAPLLW